MVENIKQRITVDDFEAFVQQHSDRTFEFIAGEIIEVPSNPFISEIAAKILILIGMYLVQHNLKDHVTGEGGGYMVNGERYAPDVAFISYARQPELARKGYNPNPPELAVEVISDPANSEEQTTLRRKIANYQQIGVIVWVVNPHERFVEVYHPEKPVQVLEENGVLSGDTFLPGFELPVKEIFPKG